MQNIKIPELLSPAGSMESMYAAVNNGANAIYLGGKSFSARSSAKNFTDDELKQVIEYAGVRGVKVYIAINTLYKNNEVYDVLLFAQKMYEQGANAFILQDIGVANEIKKHLPHIDLHASTQMSIHSLEAAKYIKKCGFNRVVLGRELSALEISEITSTVDIETEVFVHGALCVSYSGQCLMSSVIGGRSGNRGKCAQTCRLNYDLLKNGQRIKSDYLLSPKDIMTLEILNNIVDAGVSSLKIEGRMKNPEYVAIVTKAYREQLDKILYGETLINEQAIKDVTQIFNRGGDFSKSYFNTYSGKDMMSHKTPKNTGVKVGEVKSYIKGDCIINFYEDLIPGDGIKIWTDTEPHVGTSISKAISKGQNSRINIEGNISKGNFVYKSYDKALMDNAKKICKDEKKQLEIKGYIEAKQGKKLKLKVFYNNICVVKEGEKVDKAENMPTTAEKILKQLSKTGGTPYKINYENVDIDPNIYIGVNKLNELRRSALQEFEQSLINSFKREAKVTIATPQAQILNTKNQKLSVQVKNVKQLNAVLNNNISRVYIEYNHGLIKDISEIVNKCEESNIQTFVALPAILRNEDEKSLKNDIVQLEETGIKGYLVSNYGQLEILETINTKKSIVINHNLNIFNNYAIKFFENKQVGVTFSQELNLSELKSMQGNNCEIIVYGRQTVMTTHQCPIGIYDAEKANGKYCYLKNNKDKYALLDRKGFKFPISTDCNNCIAYILNSKVLDMHPKYQDIKDINVEYLRLVFTNENEQEVEEVIYTYTNMLKGIDISNQSIESTYGHFYRGVE